MAILCFYPPDKLITELVPKKVSSLFSKSNKNYALALSIAFFRSSSVASLLPNIKFSLMVPIIIVGS
jgi:hypothetical protein